jgi:hypothetical protein
MERSLDCRSGLQGCLAVRRETGETPPFSGVTRELYGERAQMELSFGYLSGWMEGC